MRIAIAALQANGGKLPEALYELYIAFRVRFLEERGLMDEVPGRSAASREALVDARAIEAFVAREWSNLLLLAFAEYP